MKYRTALFVLSKFITSDKMKAEIRRAYRRIDPLRSDAISDRLPFVKGEILFAYENRFSP